MKTSFHPHQGTKAVIGLLVVVLVGVTLGTVAGRTFVASDGLKLVPGASAQGVSNTHDWGDTYQSFALSLPSRVERSNIIAEVTVESLEPARFNTSTGGVPATPMGDDLSISSNAEWTIFRVAKLRIDHLYLGDPTLTHLVSSINGGEVTGSGPTPVLYRHTVSGTDDSRLKVGDQAMVFGWEGLVGDASDAIDYPWAYQGLLARDLINETNNNHAVYFAIAAAYIYSGTDAKSEVDVTTLPITQLQTDVENLVGP